jgi:hypothetical protein
MIARHRGDAVLTEQSAATIDTAAPVRDVADGHDEIKTGIGEELKGGLQVAVFSVYVADNADALEVLSDAHHPRLSHLTRKCLTPGIICSPAQC